MFKVCKDLVFSIRAILLVALSCMVLGQNGAAAESNLEAASENEGNLRVSSYIDGTDLLHIQGSKIWFEHLDWELPGKHDGNNYPTYANEREWYPEWLEDPTMSSFKRNSEKFDGVTPPLPVEAGYYYRITSQKLRGKIAIAQYPRPENQYECIIVLDDYDFGAAD